MTKKQAETWGYQDGLNSGKKNLNTIWKYGTHFNKHYEREYWKGYFDGQRG